VIVYRHTDPRFPFLWESGGQPAGRWNAEGEGPVNTFADRPEGAWAELLRHEEITDPRVRRRIGAEPPIVIFGSARDGVLRVPTYRCPR